MCMFWKSCSLKIRKNGHNKIYRGGCLHIYSTPKDSHNMNFSFAFLSTPYSKREKKIFSKGFTVGTFFFS